ncbi:MAG TPA: glycosyltransferase [Bacteroidia bacterium]|jgi:glycosyltransferase involved in cell wall biosynthesis
MSLNYSIVIPVYGAENALEKVHESITSFFGDRYTYEIIYVDDASSDNSWAVLKKIKSSSANTTIIRLSKNFGQHAASVCGFKYAKGEFIITMDDDLEVHPNEIQKLINEQETSNSDLVYGLYPKQNQTFFRGLLTGVYKLFSKLEGPDKGKGSSFRLIKSSLTQKLVNNHKQFIFIDELCLWYTQKLSFVNVEANKAFIEKKRYKVTDLFKLTSTIIMFSSTLPLKFVTNMGILLAGINFLIGIIFLFKKFFLKIDVEGYTSLIVSILFSTGIIILCLGIIAQYISQALKSINNAPSYNEDEVIC